MIEKKYTGAESQRTAGGCEAAASPVEIHFGSCAPNGNQ